MGGVGEGDGAGGAAVALDVLRAEGGVIAFEAVLALAFGTVAALTLVDVGARVVAAEVALDALVSGGAVEAESNGSGLALGAGSALAAPLIGGAAVELSLPEAAK